jgi:cell fate (sporulation/competence/biofilm development) regulator YlbF (YheA/YmcA/DUF963 family)
MIEAFKDVLEREKEKRKQGYRLTQEEVEKMITKIQHLIDKEDKKNEQSRTK